MTHVWHHDRKVTPFAGTSGYGYSYYRWLDPDSRRRSIRAKQLRKWLAISRKTTIAQSAKQTTTLSHTALFFRLVDEHGKPYGRRYLRLGPHECGHHLVGDQHGNQTWMDGATRVRLVNQQPEDLMSEASRLLARAHRQLTKGTE